MLESLTRWLAGDGADDLVPSSIGFNVPLPFAACVLLIAALALGMAWYYWGRLGKVALAARVAMVALRTLAAALAIFLLLDPSIIANRIRPGEQFVVLLFDDSESMRIQGEDGVGRGERLVRAYAAAEQDFEGELKRKNQLARYRVGEAIEPIQAVSDLTFEHRESNLLGAVQSALTEMRGVAVSAIVLFSDGVQQSVGGPPAMATLATGVPVFTVGVDTESGWHDVEITNLGVKRTDFDRSPVQLAVSVHSVGLAGREADVRVVLDSRVIRSKTIQITEEDEEHEVQLEFVPDRPGWVKYQAEVALHEVTVPEGQPAPPRERIVENNQRRFAVDNREKSFRILFVSGRPNWEHKFVSRAIEAPDEKELKLTSIVCIADAAFKFEFRGQKSSTANPLFEGFDEDQDRPRYDEAVWLRIGAKPGELESGYPVDPAELFGYSLVIVGSVDRELFTTRQLELTRDFVEKRGGSLLLLGGTQGFTLGNFQGSVIENMLPVVLYQNMDDPLAAPVQGRFGVRPTMEGALAGSWTFSPDSEANLREWSTMPPLYDFNRFPLARAGANVMAEIEDREGGSGDLLYAVQRYGEGRCAVLATGDTWQWQMRIEEADERHERLWRQVARNLVHGVPESTYLRNKQDTNPQGQPVPLEFVVRDKKFEKREGLHATLTLTSPAGKESLLGLDESIQEAGLYSSEFAPDEHGLYLLHLTALDQEDKPVATLEEALLVEPDQREFQQAQFNPTMLKELAKATGGKYYGLGDLKTLAKAIPIPTRTDAEEVVLHLWHQPIFYIVLVALLAVEWYMRRRRGQA